ncbi:hypothetical protein ACFWNC_14800 [Streptomyces sp. NPDC058369]|uniref:hypothetical protein n=1 Tax=Streptomyces sp. NPDC058369 TaxID=3346462 RepID=UPI003650AACC
MDESVNQKFDELTSDMRLEKLLQDLVNRADVAQIVAKLSARIYKAARKEGLPRSAAMLMARDYWDYEIKPA